VELHLANPLLAPPRRLGQRACLRADLDRLLGEWSAQGDAPPRPLMLLSAAMNPGFQATVLYRLSRGLYLRKRQLAAWFVQMLNAWLLGCEVWPTAEIGPGLRITHPVGVGIAYSKVGENLRINGLVQLGEKNGAFATVGDDVTLGVGSCLLGAVSVGDGAVVGAQSLVMCDVPARHMAVGSPARILPPAKDRSIHVELAA
jgi:serine O-acetyltransferase